VRRTTVKKRAARRAAVDFGQPTADPRPLMPLMPRWREAVKPTDEQLLDWMLTLTRPEQLAVIANLRANADDGHTCLVQNHVGRLERARG
jgi:hypothetical protein